MLGAASGLGLQTLGNPPTEGAVLNVHIQIAKNHPDGELRIMLFDADLFADKSDRISGFFDSPTLDQLDSRDNTVYELYPDMEVAGNSSPLDLIHDLVADSSMDNVWTNFFGLSCVWCG